METWKVLENGDVELGNVWISRTRPSSAVTLVGHAEVTRPASGDLGPINYETEERERKKGAKTYLYN